MGYSCQRLPQGPHTGGVCGATGSSGKEGQCGPSRSQRSGENRPSTPSSPLPVTLGGQIINSSVSCVLAYKGNSRLEGGWHVVGESKSPSSCNYIPESQALLLKLLAAFCPSPSHQPKKREVSAPRHLRTKENCPGRGAAGRGGDGQGGSLPLCRGSWVKGGQAELQEV